MNHSHRRKKLSPRQRQIRTRKYTKIGILILIILAVTCIGLKLLNPGWISRKYTEISNQQVDASEPDINVQLLTVNPYSRPGTETDRITGIVVHYTANPGSTAMDNRNYFESLKDTHETKEIGRASCRERV